MLAIATNETVNTIGDPESQVRDAEHRLTAAEQALASEVSRMVSAATTLSKRIRDARERMGRLSIASPQVMQLATTVQALALPVLKVTPLRQQALQARIEAVQFRQDALEAMREARQDCVMELAQLSELLGQAESGLTALEARPAQPKLPDYQPAEAQAAAPPAQPIEMRPPPARAAQPAPALPPPAAASVTQLAQDRRRVPRVPVHAQVDFESEHNFYTGLTIDISDGGLFIATADILPRGTQIDLNLTLPGGRVVQARGEVRWVREYNDLTPRIDPGMGIQFTEIDANAEAAIHAFVTQRDPMLFVD